MEKKPLIAVVILNYNNFNDTKECLDSVRKSIYQPLLIIVVDNASTDGSLSKLKEILEQNEVLLELDINGGYPYGNNIGLEYAFKNGVQHVLILNNDVVLDKDCIQLLYQTVSEDKAIGVIGPKVLYYYKADTINYAGIEGSIDKAEYTRIGFNEKDEGQYTKVIDTLYQDGCALLLTKKCYEKIGGFDEWFWTSSEEFDLCVRAVRSGFRVCCNQNGKVWHKVAATLGAYFTEPHHTYYMIRNRYILHRRYVNNKIKLLRVLLILLKKTLYDFIYILIKIKHPKIKNSIMLIAGTFVGITTDKKRPSDIFAPIKAVKRT